MTSIHASRLFAITTSTGRVFAVMLTTSLQLTHIECRRMISSSSSSSTSSSVMSVLGKWWSSGNANSESQQRNIVDVVSYYNNDDEWLVFKQTVTKQADEWCDGCVGCGCYVTALCWMC
jgi:hypothetical protein